MSKEKKRLPIGLENFEQIIKENYYYVDKTGLISELLRNGGMVNLFTRLQITLKRNASSATAERLFHF